MKILWLSWKDVGHPLAGGAETVGHELRTRLAQDGHRITHLTACYKGAQSQDELFGYRTIRRGGRFSVYTAAKYYYLKNLRGQFDLVIDEVNTMPFFAKFYAKEKNVLFVHQLCRQIWFYEMFFPASLVGFLLEPLYLRLLADRRVITVSESTKKDLLRNGFRPEKISIISEGIMLTPLEAQDPKLDRSWKYPEPTVLALGAVRPMKRTMDVLKAFAYLKAELPQAKLIIAGSIDGAYGAQVKAGAERSPYKADIEITGPIDEKQKAELLQKSHCLVSTSVKEGWGLVVTEAASQGTPAVVYDVDGLRDSVQSGVTGFVAAKNTPRELAISLRQALLPERNEQLRHAAWEASKSITFDQSYKDFLAAIRKLETH